MYHFLDDELFRNHADDVAAVFQCGVCHNAHQTHTPAAIDQLDSVPGQSCAEFFGSLGVSWASAFVGTAIDSDAFHCVEMPVLPELFVPETSREVVVDHARRLHVRVTNRRADKIEPALLQISAHGV